MTHRYVSLFTGAGGLDIGLERAGLEPVVVNEIEPVFCETLEANRGWQHIDGRTYLTDAKVLQGDILELTRDDLWSGGDLDLVVGGPPCQAFSSAGKQLSVLDPRGALVSEYYRVIDELRPRMFLFENVRGLVTARDKNGEPGGVITDLHAILQGLGYSARAIVLNAADFGWPQRRVRTFIVGSRNGAAPVFPEPTHAKHGGLLHKPWVTLRAFLDEHADRDARNWVVPTAAMAEQLSDIPDGSGIKSPGRAEATRPGGHWGYRQGTFIANLDLPSRTVTGSASQDWVRWEGQLRRLTLQEVKLLQGFPSDWELRGSSAQRFKQVGNAVPAIFGELLGKAIRSHLESFPSGPPEQLSLPEAFHRAIRYTKRDHARNSESRSVHHQFT